MLLKGRKRKELTDILKKYDIDFEIMATLCGVKNSRSLRSSKGYVNNLKMVERVILYTENKIKEKL